MDCASLVAPLILLLQAQAHIKPLKENYRVESCVTALLTSSMANVLSCRRSLATIEKRFQLGFLGKVSII